MPKSSVVRPPLVVLHGGPGVPHNYLKGLADLEYRSVLFFDQLSCGKSDVATPEDHGIEQAVDDVREVLKQIGIYRFHL